MYVIIVYDIGEKRVQKVCKLLRQYLNWVQNSVFEGEISLAKLKEVKMRLKKIMKLEEDSVLFYRMRTESAVKREVLGQEKSPVDTFL